jgi:hypothetical protein
MIASDFNQFGQGIFYLLVNLWNQLFQQSTFLMAPYNVFQVVFISFISSRSLGTLSGVAI